MFCIDLNCYFVRTREEVVHTCQFMSLNTVIYTHCTPIQGSWVPTVRASVMPPMLSRRTVDTRSRRHVFVRTTQRMLTHLCPEEISKVKSLNRARRLPMTLPEEQWTANLVKQMAYTLVSVGQTPIITHSRCLWHWTLWEESCVCGCLPIPTPL